LLRLKHKAAVITAGIIFLQHTLLFAAPVELTLEKSIEIALKNNPSVHIAVEDRASSLEDVIQAKAGKKPTVSLSSGYDYKKKSDTDSFSNTISMNWPVYSGGKTEAQIDVAQLNVAIADLDIVKARQALIQDATTGYYGVLEYKDMLNVKEESVNNLTAHLNIVRVKYEAGTVAKSDLLRSEVELSNAEQDMIKAQNQYEIAVISLLNVMNMDIGTEIQLADELSYQPDARTLAEAIALARQQRPEMVQAKISIDRAAKNITVAQSDKRPSVSLSASTGWDDNLLPNDERNWSVGAKASWNIFDSGVTKSKVSQAGSALNKAKLEAEQTKLTVDQEVSECYLNMREAEKRLTTTQVAVNKAVEDLYIAMETYKAGVGTNLDVLDTQLALTEAKTNHVEAIYDYNVNRAKLDKATGLEINR